jgi:peptide/nickel transport system permease protein
LTQYLARRLAFAVVLVATVSSASFVLARLAPGDYVTGTLGGRVSSEVIARERARLGLDKPLAEQYRDWAAAALRLDFGQSMLYDRPVGDLIPERAANTAILAFAALAMATVIGLPLGIVTGARRGGALAATIRTVSLVLVSMPPLLTSLALVFIAARTGWFPLAIALPLAAALERLQAQSMSETIGQPFVLAAAARGLPRGRVVWRGALKAALRPIAAMYGLMIGTLLSGSFAVEVITAWPGLGTLMLQALRARDIYLIAGCAGAGALFLALGTMVSDVALAVVDPRASEPGTRVEAAA